MELFARLALTVGLLGQIGICLKIVKPQNEGTMYFTEVVEVGSRLTLSCEMEFTEDGESPFHNSIRWRKTQRQEEYEQPEEGVEISTNTDIRDLFSDRLTISFPTNVGGSNIQANITIANVQLEDSGWYFCYSKKGDDVFWIRYLVQVNVPPQDVYLTGGVPGYNSSGNSDMLTFYAQEGGTFVCTATRSNPPATLKIHIEGEENAISNPAGGGTSQMQILEGETVGLQSLLYNSSLTLTNVQVRADQNGKRVMCSVVNGENGPTDSKTLSVQFPPRIVECDENWQAAVNDEQVTFGCTFEAHPLANTVVWTAQARPAVDIYPDGKAVDGLYSAQLKVTTQKGAGNISLFRTDLTLIKITSNSFHRYNLLVGNGRGEDTKDFVLTEGERPVQTNGDNNNNDVGRGVALQFSWTMHLLVLLVTAAAIYKQ